VIDSVLRRIILTHPSPRSGMTRLERHIMPMLDRVDMLIFSGVLWVHLELLTQDFGLTVFEFHCVLGAMLGRIRLDQDIPVACLEEDWMASIETIARL